MQVYSVIMHINAVVNINIFLLHSVSEQSKMTPGRNKSKPRTPVAMTSSTQREIDTDHDDNKLSAVTGTVGLRSSSSFPSLALTANTSVGGDSASPQTNQGDAFTGRNSRSSARNDRSNHKAVVSSTSNRPGQSRHRSNPPRDGSLTLKTTTDEDLLEYLNTPAVGDLDESCLLRNEIDSQSKEISMLLKDHRKLQTGSNFYY